MSTQLHQAVQLAQAGQRSEARQLLWQFLQAEPNNEVAWLWLASVAADQGEYRRALNEVLRINPANQRAQQLMADLQQQYGTPPPAAQPYAPSTPPPIYGQQVSPPPPRPQYPVSQPVEVQVVKTVERRRGCLGCALPVLPGCGGCLGCGGCGQGCLLALLVLVIAPALLCVGLSFSPVSLGPLDFFLSYLPGEMGRKDIEFATDDYDVTLKAPRSWYLVQTNDQMWGFWRDALESTIPFENANQEWADLETLPGADALIVDMNPVNLTEGGSLIQLILLPDTTSGDYTCDAVESSLAGQTHEYPVLFRYDNDLCGYREDKTEAGPPTRILKNIEPPAQVRTIEFFVPLSTSTAAHWQIGLPDDLYGRYEDDITALIESVDMQPR